MVVLRHGCYRRMYYLSLYLCHTACQCSSSSKLILYSIGTERDSIVQHAWGVCHRGQLFKYEAGDLIPLEREGNSFVVLGYTLNKILLKRPGEMVGTFFANERLFKVENYIKDHSVTAIPYLGEFQPSGTIIDMRTGDLIF